MTDDATQRFFYETSVVLTTPPSLLSILVDLNNINNIFQLSGKIQVFVHIFAFFYFLFLVRWLLINTRSGLNDMFESQIPK